MITTQNKDIQALVEAVREGSLLLPELQRSFVWKSTQVRDLFDSLYHQYPSGQILVWETDDLPYSHKTSLVDIRSDQKHPQLLLDGQQRVTSLAAVLLGKDLIVRGSLKPIDIAFNVHTEKFEVAGPRQSKETGWISLTKLFTEGVLSIIVDLGLDTKSKDAQKVFERLTRLESIKTYKYQVNVLEKLSYEEVTHIFVRINSGGTKLGSADLALAQISSRWRGVTDEFSKFQKELSEKGLELDTGILIRTLTALLTGQTKPSQLFRGERQSFSVDDLKSAWNRLVRSMNQVLLFLSTNCSIDNLDLLPTQYVLIPLTTYFDYKRGVISNEQIRDLKRWTYMALLWSRYSASAESMADQDVAALKTEDPIETMIQNIEDKAGIHRLVTERDLRDQRKNSPLMLMAYILAKTRNAQDWFNGLIIGGNQLLELHHIFPKEVLREKYDLRVDSRTVDQVANLVFLSKRASSKVNSQPPNEYLGKIDAQRLSAQYVPLDQELWTLEHFEEFMLERRNVLAGAINHLLQSLTEKPALWPSSDIEVLESRVDTIEHQMRILISQRFIEARNDEAWMLIPANLRKQLDGRIQNQIVKYPYLAKKLEQLDYKLSFCQFSDYLKIISENWILFKDLFGDPLVFEKHFQQVIDTRNAMKHNQEINLSKLHSGEAGLIWLEDCLREGFVEEIEVDSYENENGNSNNKEEQLLVEE